MEYNFLKLLFGFMTATIVVVGNLVNFFEKYLPIYVVQSFRYGKFAYSGKERYKLVEVPKSWFKHFYVFATLYSFFALYTTINVYICKSIISDSFIKYLNFFAGGKREATVEPVAVILALSLLSAQSLRRFIETWYISVFSAAKMNLSLYLIGFLHYWGAVTVILSDAKYLSSQSELPPIHISQVTLTQVLAIILFGFAWWNQYKCAVILANLRKDPRGAVTTVAHKIPRDGLFTILSSPHLTCEIVIYVALTIILWDSSTFLYVSMWVFSNQAECALLNHWWYKKTFSNYPKEKKALIPYIL